MEKEIWPVACGSGPRIEAYRLKGACQPFPSHFHDYYVIGLVAGGERTLSCKSQEHAISKGDILLFNPGDSHGCVQSGGPLDYLGFNITRQAMLSLAEEATGRRELPGFSSSVVRDGEAACYLRSLYGLVMKGSSELEKEECLLLLLSLLIRQYSRPFESCVPECRDEIERACAFMEGHCGERIRLEEVCRCAGLSKSTLLRAFVKSKGVTPYRYLENIRIGRAKKLLEQGVPPIEAALQTGFSDQSHFTHYFSRFMGLTPGDYQGIFSDERSGRHGLEK